MTGQNRSGAPMHALWSTAMHTCPASRLEERAVSRSVKCVVEIDDAEA
jgi:hypothetical protein